MKYQYDKENTFAKILNNEIKTQKIFENNSAIVIQDINPIAEIHYLVIAKGTYINYEHFVTSASEEEMVNFFKSIEKVATKLKINNKFRLISNNGLGQNIRHFHIHIISGKIFNQSEISITH